MKLDMKDIDELNKTIIDFWDSALSLNEEDKEEIRKYNVEDYPAF